LGLLLTASCSKASLMAPSSSTLTLLVSRTTVGLSASVTVTALVNESSGTPVHDGTVVAFFSTLGTISPAQATTTNGQATVQLLTGTQSGVAEITATSGGAKLASTVKVGVGAAAVARVDLMASPTSLPSIGGTTLLTATVSDGDGNRLSGIPVTFYTDNGNLDQSGVSTNSNGQVQGQLTTTVRASVTASVAGGTSGSVRSDPVIITVSVTFGDGTSQGSLSPGNQSVVHVYPRIDNFPALLTVTDAAGETMTASTTVVVK
jgi:hypothetical protein